jgi:hypothetical protein
MGALLAKGMHAISPFPARPRGPPANLVDLTVATALQRYISKLTDADVQYCFKRLRGPHL